MKKALTIGELLVTIAIIGIIATLVLPGFMQDYNRKIYVTHLKKMIEMIEAAVTQACTDNNVSYFYQTPYATTDGDLQKEFIEKYFKTMGSNNISQTYGAINTDSSKAETFTNTLAGGEYLIMRCNNDKTDCVFTMDINGKNAPNIGGRDAFVITLSTKDNKLYGANPEKCGGNLRSATESEEDYKNRMKTSTTYSTNGAGCYEHIVRDNWEMKY